MFSVIRDETSKCIIAGLLTEIKRKPVLIIHFQVSLIFLLALFSILNHLMKFVPTRVRVPLLLPLAVIVSVAIVSLIVYIYSWKALLKKVKTIILDCLEDYFRDFPDSFESAISTTLYDIVDPQDLRKIIPSIAVFPVSYYGIWISFLLFIDMVIFSVTHFSCIVFLFQHLDITITTLVLTIITSVIFVDIWPNSYMAQGRKSMDELIFFNIADYVRYFFEEKFLIPRISEQQYGTIISVMLTIFRKIFIPLPYTKTKILLVDTLQLPYVEAIQRKFNSMICSSQSINSKSTGGYILYPLKKRCINVEKIPSVKIPFLSSACWYKVIKDGRTIGYIMVFKFTVERFPYIMSSRRVRMHKERYLFILMFGTEEIVELKYMFLK